MLNAPTAHRPLDPPLIHALVPVRNRALRTAVQLGAGVLAMALLAQLRVNIGPVPVTGQTLGVLLIGAAYGRTLAGTTMLLYLLAGALGLGVFTGGGAGWSHLSGATAGYLLSYPLAAALIGALAERGGCRSFGRAALVMLLGNACIYLPGLLWLSTFAAQYAPGAPALTWTLSAGLLPFIPGDALKLLLAAALLPGAQRLLGRRVQ